MRTRVLITGGNGQLGSELTKILPNYFTVLSTVHIESINNSKVLNITSYDNIKETFQSFKPDVIVNAAAFTNVDICETNKKQAHDVNVGGLQNLIRASSKETRIIQISSDYVFDGNNGPYKESDQPNPINYYGKTKLEAENTLRGSQVKHLIIRPNVVYSSDFNNFNNFVSWVYNSLKNKTKINIVTDQISNPTNTTQLAKAIVKSILLQCEGIFHFGSEDYLSRYDFANLIAKIFNLNAQLIQPINTDSLKQKAKRPLHSGLCIQKFEKQLDFSFYKSEFILNKINNKMASA